MTDKLLNKDIDKRVVSQFEYIEKIREINKGKVKKVYAKTFGCAQNEADMANMLGMCRAAGYEICSEKEQADIILYNTCAVREHAELRVMGNIGALKGLKKLKPDLIIIIAGCMIQQEHIQRKLSKNTDTLTYFSDRRMNINFRSVCMIYLKSTAVYSKCRLTMKNLLKICRIIPTISIRR